MIRLIAALAFAAILGADAPVRVAFECTEADTQAANLSCSAQEPCPVFLELNSVEAVGNKVFVAGNLHTSTTTLFSILLATDDAGKTWNEPHPRIRFAGLDEIQFIDFENGWISGGNLQSTPRDPFLLLTTDGGKTWHVRPIFDEARVASIERFWFASRENGSMLIDARLDNNMHELYESRTGGESWSMKQASASPIPFPRAKDPARSGWRLRVNSTERGFDLEKSDGTRWQKTASFLVNVGACKE